MSLPPDLADLEGRPARSADGVDLGPVAAVFGAVPGVSDGYVGIPSRDGLVVIPLSAADTDPADGALVLPHDVDRLNAAPAVAPDTEILDAATERRITEHFGPAAAPVPPTAALPSADEPTAITEAMIEPPAADPPDEPDAELVLSEEQLHVETQRMPVERVRLRKEVVTEEVTVTVTLRRQELVIERTPIDDDDPLAEPAGGIVGEDEAIDIVLWAEEPVVTTRAVPVERVRVHREVVADEQDITAELRRERATVDHPPGGPNA